MNRQVLKEYYQKYTLALTQKSQEDFHQFKEHKQGLSDFQTEFLQKQFCEAQPDMRQRFLAEVIGHGPLGSYLQDQSVTEIMLCGPESLWIEKNGQLEKLNDFFICKESYLSFVDRLCEEANIYFDLKKPAANGVWQGHRVHLVAPPLTPNYPKLTLRRSNTDQWTFKQLFDFGWASQSPIEFLKTSISNRKNILVIGATNSGKTSALNACLSELSETDRVVCIEDTSELTLPNQSSVKLITRLSDEHGFKNYDLGHLVKESLRMRPDRLVLGEVRGAEAKDLLMALATGHRGSLSTLHADDPYQALIRLEMLIQLGAPQWSLQAIRHLIRLSLDLIVVVKKSATQRVLSGIYEISSLEPSGFCLEAHYQREV